MFTIDTSDIQRFAVSAVGAIILSAACVFSAVGPARAAEKVPSAVATGIHGVPAATFCAARPA